jgi:hypothetical protein
LVDITDASSTAGSNDDSSTFLEIANENAGLAVNREEYLAVPTVAGFVSFLKEMLGTSERPARRLRHCWVHENEGYEWQCDGLLDAAHKYRYKVNSNVGFRGLTGDVDFQSLTANAIVLSDLQRRLRQAVALGHPAGELQAVSVAKEVQVWGGTDRGDHNSDAIDYLSMQSAGFIGYLQICRQSFGTSNSLSLLPFVGSGYGLRSNAGFTKIYSLLYDDFIIYDSRVAAALGLLIVRYWSQSSVRSGRQEPLPEELAFLCMPEAGKTRRDPNLNVFNVGKFPTGSGKRVFIRHLRSNVFANWILTATLAGSAFSTEVRARPHPYGVDPLRALEAALFMIGYDLDGNYPHMP